MLKWVGLFKVKTYANGGKIWETTMEETASTEPRQAGSREGCRREGGKATYLQASCSLLRGCRGSSWEGPGHRTRWYCSAAARWHSALQYITCGEGSAEICPLARHMQPQSLYPWCVFVVLGSSFTYAKARFLLLHSIPAILTGSWSIPKIPRGNFWHWGWNLRLQHGTVRSPWNTSPARNLPSCFPAIPSLKQLRGIMTGK